VVSWARQWVELWSRARWVYGKGSADVYNMYAPGVAKKEVVERLTLMGLSIRIQILCVAFKVCKSFGVGARLPRELVFYWSVKCFWNGRVLFSQPGG